MREIVWIFFPFGGIVVDAEPSIAAVTFGADDMVIEAGLPNRVTDAFCDGTLSLSDDTRYRRDEHGSSVVAVEKEQKVDMIRHDDVVINIDGGINLVNPDTNP